jgi:FkbM family methyltransferase
MIREVVGAAMRLYRNSPLHHPAVGKALARALSMLPRSKSVVRDVNGLKFRLDLDEIIDSSLYYSGTFEANAERAIAGALRSGMTAVDVGANVGYHTLRMARAVGAAGKVIAIEPTSWAIARLRENIALNAFTNVDVLQIGLAATDEGWRSIRFRSSYRLDGRVDTAEESVQIRALDGVTADLTRLDFIKIDVDGSEGKVLDGARETLRRFRPMVLFEITPSAMVAGGDSPDDLLALLSGLGYRFREDDGSPLSDVRQRVARIKAGDGINLIAEHS